MQKPREHRVHAGKQVEPEFRYFLDEAGHVAGVGDKDIEAALGHDQQAVTLQREDVVERQRRDGHHRFHAIVGIALPAHGLLDVINHVAVAEHRTLRHAGSAARVLQVGDIGETYFDVGELLLRACTQRVPERDAVIKLVAWYLAPDMPKHEIDQQALREPEEIAYAGRNDVLDVRVVDDFLEDVCKVFEYHDALCAGIRELVFQFASRVKGVDVDDDQPCTERAAHRDRVLEYVRQHDCDALAACHLELLLQVTGELHRHLVEVPVADRRSHVGVCRVVRILLETVLDHFPDRPELRRRHLLGDAGRIGFQPDFFHAWMFLVRPVISFWSVRQSE